MKKINAIHLIGDAVQIAKWLSWHDETGRVYADELVEKIHSGRYGNNEGVWVQVGRAMRLIAKDIV